MFSHIKLGLALLGGTRVLDPPGYRLALGTPFGCLEKEVEAAPGASAAAEAPMSQLPRGPGSGWRLEKRREAVICGVSCPGGKAR